MIDRRLAAVRAVVATVVMLAATAAWAADCGDAAGLGGTRVACACGDTVVTDTTLKSTDPVVSTGPGVVCAGDGLEFGGPDLTLDCKGLTVRGPGGSGIGIALGGTSQRAERNQAEGNLSGIVADRFSSGRVVTQNRTVGNEAGIGVAGSGHPLFANITDGNSAGGILVVAGPNIALDGNRGKDNGGHGLAVTGTGNTLRRNVYDANGGHGICAVAGDTDGGANRGTGNVLQPGVDFSCTP